MTCPSCHRPVAVPGPQCLYCGAPLTEDLGAMAQARAAEPPMEAAGGPTAERILIILNLDRAEVVAVARALGVSLFEAGQRIRRGGYQLHRIAPPAEADAEAERFAQEGLAVTRVPEEEARAARPLVAVGGSLDAGSLLARSNEGLARVAAEDLLLVVRGPIAREYQPSAVKRLRTAKPEEGYVVHFHRRLEARPVELDPEALALGPGAAESALLQITGWVEALAGGVPVDDGFRRIPPALAPTREEPPGAASAAGALLRTRKEEGAVVLDNREQFRFYSAWRAAVERRRHPGAR